MKNLYYKPEMTVVALNQRQALLNPTSQTSGGPSSDFMSDPTIRTEAPAKENKGVWDEEW
jgi:hypothetical protein